MAKIAAEESPLSGRAIARLSDLGWGQRLRELVGPGAPDVECPEWLVDPVVEVLKTWGWDVRPGAVASVPSRSRPALVASVAAMIAKIGRLPDLGALDYAHDGPHGARGGNSAFRLANVWDAFIVPSAMKPGLDRLDGAPVLLVDDLADSRWTLTIAARTLRLAGAPAVLPFTLALDA